jgi:RNA polymerase sigma-70 factor (ECF subfamily)
MDELIPTRATLLQRLKNWQDQSSWQEFFDTYWKLIYDLSRQSGLNEVEAEDVVQETMIAVARHMPTFKYDPAIGSFKGWLFNLTRWRITDQVRKRNPLALSEALPADEQCADDTAAAAAAVERVIDPESGELEQRWNADWEKHLFAAAVARVKRRVDPEKYQVFDVYVNKEWAPEKVAASFGITVEQVYLIKHRVTDMIKAEVKRLEREMV